MDMYVPSTGGTISFLGSATGLSIGMGFVTTSTSCKDISLTSVHRKC